jgi:hypothetical protein
MSGEHTDQIAPRLAAARNTTMVVRHDRADAVAAPHAHGLQRRGAGGHLTTQLGPGGFLQLTARQHRLVGEDDRRMTRGAAGVGMAQQVLRIVELDAGEPARARHRGVLQHRAVRRR